MGDVRVPDGVRAGQLSVLTLGRVITGDIAVTMVDLAIRKLARVEEAQDGDWLVSPLLASAPRHRRESLLGYEEKLLAGLGEESRLSALTSELGPALDKVRTALGREAVHQGWVRHLHHDQRTAKGDELAGRVGSFERDLRRLKLGEGEEALTGELLPYALHFALVSRDEVPLARFAQDWGRAFADLPGWRPAWQKRQFDDDALFKTRRPPGWIG